MSRQEQSHNQALTSKANSMKSKSSSGVSSGPNEPATSLNELQNFVDEDEIFDSVASLIHDGSSGMGNRGTKPQIGN